MKYMLMMHAPRGKGDWAVFNWPPEDLKAHVNFMKRFNKELKDAGELVGAEGLAGPDQARAEMTHLPDLEQRVTARIDSEMFLTDQRIDVSRAVHDQRFAAART